MSIYSLKKLYLAEHKPTGSKKGAGIYGYWGLGFGGSRPETSNGDSAEAGEASNGAEASGDAGSMDAGGMMSGGDAGGGAAAMKDNDKMKKESMFSVSRWQKLSGIIKEEVEPSDEELDALDDEELAGALEDEADDEEVELEDEEEEEPGSLFDPRESVKKDKFASLKEASRELRVECIKESNYPDTAEEYAHMLNAQKGDSPFKLVTDQEHWNEYGVHTGEELAHYLVSMEHYDLYKDIHGIRPRGIDYKLHSIEEIEKMIDELTTTRPTNESVEHKKVTITKKELQEMVNKAVSKKLSNPKDES